MSFYENADLQVDTFSMNVDKHNDRQSVFESHQKTIKFIDLFAGMGGTRIGFEQACKDYHAKTTCVFTSEIKSYAKYVYSNNFKENNIHGDITKIAPINIPDFDYLLAGFPCQPFSSAGNRNGLLDKRGELFFTLLDIIKTKKPKGFLLENVDGLISHDGGKTIKLMISSLEALEYKVSYKSLDSIDFGVPQKRKRVYIIGRLDAKPEFKPFNPSHKTSGNFIQYDKQFVASEFGKLLNSMFDRKTLEGKAIKDKRGGEGNIHSWDLELKGQVSKEQKVLLELILKKRRYKKWASDKGIDWMDGMPLTLQEILTFHPNENTETLLNDLTSKGYLKFEHPKKRVEINGIFKRIYNTDAAKGYNIVAGKLSFPFTKILDPNDFVPTLVATEAGKIAVATDNGVRAISVREGLNFSGYPETYSLDGISYKESFDLLGNTVMPPVIRYVAQCLLKVN